MSVEKDGLPHDVHDISTEQDFARLAQRIEKHLAHITNMTTYQTESTTQPA